MSNSLPLPLTPARPAPLVVAMRAGQSLPAGMGQPELDAAVRLAAHVCAAPMAFVAWTEGDGDAARRVPTLQAATGITLPELARDFAALRPLLGASGLVVIEDAAAPGAGAGEPGFAFLAGAPLHAAGNAEAVGTVAVLDRSPRSLDPVQRAALQDLAAVLSSTLTAHQRSADLARHATVDLLTGIANRKQFDAVMLAELHHAMRSGETFTLLLLSLDGVQDIRNGFGVAAGDAALREVCARMARQVRLGDLLARLSGFEFGAVMRHGAADAAELLAQRIVDAVRQPIELDSGDVVGLRVCIGIAAYDDGIDSVAALTSRAEQALQRARRQHEQRWNFFGRRFEAAPSLRLVGGETAGPDTSI